MHAAALLVPRGAGVRTDQRVELVLVTFHPLAILIQPGGSEADQGTVAAGGVCVLKVQQHNPRVAGILHEGKALLLLLLLLSLLRHLLNLVLVQFRVCGAPNTLHTGRLRVRALPALRQLVLTQSTLTIRGLQLRPKAVLGPEIARRGHGDMNIANRGGRDAHGSLTRNHGVNARGRSLLVW